jgi:hypothetical protein
VSQLQWRLEGSGFFCGDSKIVVPKVKWDFR